MSKDKITISLDERILQIIDRQRGDTKRSTYINAMLEEQFSPRTPEEKGGGTFVTTLELRKTLKNVHDRVSHLEALSAVVKDLEILVYEELYDVKERNKVKTKKGNPVMSMAGMVDEAVIRRVDKWIDSVIEKEGSMRIERDLPQFKRIDGIEKTQIAFTRHLLRNGLEYSHKSHKWTRP